MQLDFLIRRRGLDPAGETALHALRDLMHAPIVAVERGTLWRFDVEDDADVRDVQQELERAASRAGRYLNTNRDVGAWLDAGCALQAQHEGAGCAVSLWITSGDGRDDVARDYFRKRASARLARVRRGTLYLLSTSVVDVDAAREIVLDVAVTRSRAHGLLLNPHHEQFEVLSVTPLTDPAEAT